MANIQGYPIFKGLQRPLEFMGIRGRFIYIAAGAIGGSFLGFLLISFLLGKTAGFVAMFLIALISLIVIFVKQKQGLHTKKKCRDLLVYKIIFNR